MPKRKQPKDPNPIVTVQFVHDNRVKKWEVFVFGARTPDEARQALNAVLLTCRDENVLVCMLHPVRAITPDIMEIEITQKLKLEKMGNEDGTV